MKLSKKQKMEIINFIKKTKIHYVWRFFLRLSDFPKYINVFGVQGLSIFTKIHVFMGKSIIEIKVPGIDREVYLRFNTSDRAVFNQIFVKKEYDYNIDFDPKYILDIGANNGYSAVYFKNRFPESIIYSIEPDDDNFNIFIKNTEKYKNIIGINKGIWHKNTFLKIKNPDGENSSFELVETDENNGIESITIDSILEKYNFDKIDILKMDIEGAEKDVFGKNSDHWINATRLMFVETHDRKKAGTEKIVLEKVKQNGFKIDKSGENLVIKK